MKVKEYLYNAKEVAKVKLGKFKTMIVPALAMLVTSAAMAPVAHALEGGDSSDTGMSAILASIPTIISLMGEIWKVMTGNPLLTLFLAVSLVMVGIKVFRRVKGAAK